MLKQLGRTALAAKKLITINKYFKNTLPQKKNFLFTKFLRSLNN